ncbi:MAG: molybdopterin-binding protein [Lachnospiraceae bacterium]|nr:molybdopterin-binding protein [Lachnospiraceae bacterium]
MKSIKTTDAVGCVLAHDITQIIPGKFKGPVFKKGHIVQEEDIPVLLSVGKENLYVYEKKEGELHEDEAAFILKDIAIGENSELKFSGPSEGKIEIKTPIDGLFKVRSEALIKVNSVPEIMIASRHSNTPVFAGDKLAGMRVIPLVIASSRLDEAKAAAGDEPLFSVLPFKKMKYALITTGSEVYKGLIKDAFGPVIDKKMSEYNCTRIEQKILPDGKEGIKAAIKEEAEKGAELILVSGGMSVDPDDTTPSAISESVDKVSFYGAPVLPGAMFMLGYLTHEGKTIPVMGLPGCVMYAGRTIFDLVLLRILAGEILEREDIVKYGEGGLCLNCEVCHYPNCGFGK